MIPNSRVITNNNQTLCDFPKLIPFNVTTLHEYKHKKRIQHSSKRITKQRIETTLGTKEHDGRYISYNSISRKSKKSSTTTELPPLQGETTAQREKLSAGKSSSKANRGARSMQESEGGSKRNQDQDLRTQY